jgi:hypothetical protein
MWRFSSAERLSGMDEAHELHKKIARCRRSLLVMSHPAPMAALDAMIKEAESRLAELEREKVLVPG